MSILDYADHFQGISTSEERDRRTNTTIRIYTPEEIEGVRQACRIGREVLDIVGNAVRIGVTCDELDRIVSYHCFFSYLSRINLISTVGA